MSVESPFSYRMQYQRMLNYFLGVESDWLCVVGKLDAKYGPRFVPENVCYSQMQTLFMTGELSLYPHVILLAHSLWYRILSVYDNSLDKSHPDYYTPCGLLACSFVVALAAVGGNRSRDDWDSDYVTNLMKRVRVSSAVITSKRLKDGCIYLMEQLGFQLFNPTLLHMMDTLIQLDALPDSRTVMEFKRSGDAKYPVFYETLLCMFAEPRFMCLPPSLQTAGLLRYLGRWNKQASRCLRRSDDEAMNAARLVYYSLAYMQYKLKMKTEINDRFEATRLLQNEALAVDDVTATSGSEYEIASLIDDCFAQICSECVVVSGTVNVTDGHGTGSSAPPYTVVADRDAFNKQFKIIKTLGEGSYGTVRHVVETATGASFAMKTMDLKTSDDTFFEDLKNMAHEFAATQHLGSHRGIMDIVRMYRFKTPRSEIVQQIRLYEEGFHASLEKKKDLAYYRSVVRGFLTGLQEIHDHGFVHSDIKPANILVDEYKQSVIADLGMLFFPCSTTVSDNVYTYPYRAPEVSMYGLVSWQSDMWAVGVVLLEILFATQGKLFLREYNTVRNEIVLKSNPAFHKELIRNRKDMYSAPPELLASVNIAMSKHEILTEMPKHGSEYAHLCDLIKELLIPITSAVGTEKRPNVSECLRHKFFN